MASLLNLLRSGSTSPKEERFTGLSFNDYLEMFSFNGNTYYGAGGRDLSASKLDPDNSFAFLTEQVYKRSGVVAAAITARALLLSQLRFQFKSLSSGDTNRTFTTNALAALEQPAGGITRPQLLHTAEQHVSLAGAAYFHMPRGEGARLLRPDWVTLMFSSDVDNDHAIHQQDCTFVGVIYTPGGPASKAAPQFIPNTDVAPWAPEPDPVCWWRGQSWVQSVLREISTDKQTAEFKSKFFENSATPQLIFTLDPSVTQDQAQKYAEIVNARHEGSANAYRSLVMGGGAQVTVAGSNLQQLDLRATQGADETRIALRARVPAVVLGIGEGLGGSALNSGNYAQTRRLWADGWFSPTAQSLCATLDRVLVRPPGGPSELTYDPASVMFLQEDRKDEAEIMSAHAVTMRQLVDGGFDPATIVSAVTTNDLTKLRHSGLYSVQLQEPGAPDQSPQGVP